MEPTISFSLAPPLNLVIQCSSCKTIVGDTAANSYAATIGATKIIAVPAASDVTVDRIPQKDTLDSQTYTYFHLLKFPEETKSEVGAVGVANAIRTEPTAATAAANGAAPANNVGDLLARIETLETEMLKMQGMILLHDGQLQTLPGYPVAAEGGML
ncbi:hypothetical protein Ndes2437B_g06128 [Nannochloris sp. 'desiccata']